MFSSIFSTSPPVDPKAPNLHSVTDAVKDGQFYGELTPKDTEWACPGGFAAETQVFYTNTEDGKSLMCQVIHSSIGVWYPSIQFTFKLYDSKTKEKVWKVINVSNFVTPPPGRDKRSCKADQFSITHKSSPDNAEFPESYTISANLAMDLQVHIELARPAAIPGWKVGNGEKGGFSYLGPDLATPEGYVVHRFWPQYKATGHVVHNGAAIPIVGPGMFVHAIQGMRPNLVASAWNFADFQSEEKGGVSAIQMEFTTTETHGKTGVGSGGVKVNIGSLVVGGKLVSVVAQTHYPGEADAAGGVVSKASHLDTAHDPDTGYMAPSTLLFEWAGPSIVAGKSGNYTAKIAADVGDLANPKGLIEKVDFLAEIPYAIKMAVNYLAGTKPFIYQWFLESATLTITEPGSDETVEVAGSFYAEASFISILPSS
ncbi:oxidative stress survival, Svf1-like protein [Hymenopellis radicata]|nr:oxidative stress survival, Svf1-like protein [Hymenopellis radicata]